MDIQNTKLQESSDTHKQKMFPNPNNGLNMFMQQQQQQQQQIMMRNQMLQEQHQRQQLQQQQQQQQQIFQQQSQMRTPNFVGGAQTMTGAGNAQGPIGSMSAPGQMSTHGLVGNLPGHIPGGGPNLMGNMSRELLGTGTSMIGQSQGQMENMSRGSGFARNVQGNMGSLIGPISESISGMERNVHVTMGNMSDPNMQRNIGNISSARPESETGLMAASQRPVGNFSSPMSERETSMNMAGMQRPVGNFSSSMPERGTSIMGNVQRNLGGPPVHDSRGMSDPVQRGGTYSTGIPQENVGNVYGNNRNSVGNPNNTYGNPSLNQYPPAMGNMQNVQGMNRTGLLPHNRSDQEFIEEFRRKTLEAMAAEQVPRTVRNPENILTDQSIAPSIQQLSKTIQSLDNITSRPMGILRNPNDSQSYHQSAGNVPMAAAPAEPAQPKSILKKSQTNFDKIVTSSFSNSSNVTSQSGTFTAPTGVTHTQVSRQERLRQVQSELQKLEVMRANRPSPFVPSSSSVQKPTTSSASMQSSGPNRLSTSGVQTVHKSQITPTRKGQGQSVKQGQVQKGQGQSLTQGQNPAQSGAHVSGGQSIPTLVSSVRKESIKRKTDHTKEASSGEKRPKVVQRYTSQEQDDEEDPEYVQSQVYVGNLPLETSKDFIAEILKHYHMDIRVWMGNSLDANSVCAFVKMPSMKDSRRVIGEMKGFPFKGRPMDVRFTAAADFENFKVVVDRPVPLHMANRPADVKQQPATPTQPQSELVQYPPPSYHPTPIVDLTKPPPGMNVPPPRVAPPAGQMVAPPTTNVAGQPVSGLSVIASAYTPTRKDSLVRRRSPSPRQKSPPRGRRTYSRSPVRRSFSRNRSPKSRRLRSLHSQERSFDISRHRSQSPRQHFIGRSPRRSSYDRSPKRRSLDRSLRRRSHDRSPWRRSHDRSPRRRSKSPRKESDDRSMRRRSFSPRRRRSASPRRGSRGRSPKRTRNRETFKSNKDHRPRNSSLSDVSDDISQSSIQKSSHKGQKDSPVTLTRASLRSFSPDRRRNRSQSPRSRKSRSESQRSPQHEQILQRQSLSPVSDIADSFGVPGSPRPDWFNQDQFELESPYAVPMPVFHQPMYTPFLYTPVMSEDQYMQGVWAAPGEVSPMSGEMLGQHAVKIGGLPVDVTDIALEDFIHQYKYQSVHLKVRQGKAAAYVFFDSYGEADDMVRQLDGQILYGQPVAVKHDMGAGLDNVKPEQTLFQSFVDASYANAPVLGRNYINEFKSESGQTAYYVCLLCEVVCSWRTVADHVMGYKHRLKCLKQSHPKQYDELCHIRNKVDMLAACAKYASQCVNLREKITKNVVDNPEQAAYEMLDKIKDSKSENRRKSREERGNKDRSEGDKSSRDRGQGDKSSRDKGQGDKGSRDKGDRRSRDKGQRGRSHDRAKKGSSSDIFKRIEAYKKKLKEQADKPDIEEESKGTTSFEDVAKQNKSPTVSIVSELKATKEQSEKPVTEGGQKDMQHVVKDAKKRIAESIAMDEKLHFLEKVESKPDSEAKASKPSNVKVSVKADIIHKTGDMIAIRLKDKPGDKTGKEKKMDDTERVEIGETSNVTSEAIVESEILDADVKRDSTDGDQTVEGDDSGGGDFFEEELGNMEEEETGEEQAEPVALPMTAKPAQRPYSTHPRSQLATFINIQKKKDAEHPGEIGLQYLTEVIPKKKSRPHQYSCGLCDVLSHGQMVMDHLCGLKHILKYLEVHYPSRYEEVQAIDCARAMRRRICSTHVRHIALMEGPQAVMSITEQEWTAKLKKKEFEVVKPVEISAVSDERTDTEVVDESLESDRAEDENTTNPVDNEMEQSDQPTSTAGLIQEPKVKLSPGMFKSRLIKAKAAARMVKPEDGRNWVAMYKFLLTKADVPLLGMEYITEIQHFMGPEKTTLFYTCDLCSKCFKITDTLNAFQHITGQKHMEKYITKHFPQKLIKFKLLKTSSQKTSYLQNQAKIINALHGKSSLKVVDMNKVDLEEKGCLPTKIVKVKDPKEVVKVNSPVAKVKDETSPVAKVIEVAEATTAELETKVTEFEQKWGQVQVKALLYDFTQKLKDQPVVGLHYITEFQGGNKPYSYLCCLCGEKDINVLLINNHLTSNKHRLNFLQANYPVLHSKSEGKKDMVDQYCNEIEAQFGRESISVVRRLPGDKLSKPIIVKGPSVSQLTDNSAARHKDLLASLENLDDPSYDKGQDVTQGQVNVSQRSEGEVNEDIVLYTIIQGLDSTPLLGLQYITEIHHPDETLPPVYECEVCGSLRQNHLTTKNIFKHICSKGHRFSFFKENHLHIYNEIMNEKNESSKHNALTRHTKDIESKVGRGSVQRRVSSEAYYWPKGLETMVIKSPASSVAKDFKKPGNGPARYRCRLCGYLVENTKQTANKHLSFAHTYPYQCRQCEFAGRFRKSLVQHYANSHKVNAAVMTINQSFNGCFEICFTSKLGVYMDKDGKIIPKPECILDRAAPQLTPIGQQPSSTITQSPFTTQAPVTCAYGSQMSQSTTPVSQPIGLQQDPAVQLSVTQQGFITQSTHPVAAQNKPMASMQSQGQQSMPSGASSVQGQVNTQGHVQGQVNIQGQVNVQGQGVQVYGPQQQIYSAQQNVQMPTAQQSHFYGQQFLPGSAQPILTSPMQTIVQGGQNTIAQQGPVYSQVSVQQGQPMQTVYPNLQSSVPVQGPSFGYPGEQLGTNTVTQQGNFGVRGSNVTDLRHCPQNIQPIVTNNPQQHEAIRRGRTALVPIQEVTSAPISSSSATLDLLRSAVYKSIESELKNTGGQKTGEGINVCVILAQKEDPSFDWAYENGLIQSKINEGLIRMSKRKSKFMLAYTSTFSNYPLLGLQYVCEYQQENLRLEPFFMCELCRDRITSVCIAAHIKSLKHNLWYMARDYDQYYQKVVDSCRKKTITTETELHHLVSSLCDKIKHEEKQPRQITVYVEVQDMDRELCAAMLQAKSIVDGEMSTLSGADSKKPDQRLKPKHEPVEVTVVIDGTKTTKTDTDVGAGKSKSSSISANLKSTTGATVKATTGDKPTSTSNSSKSTKGKTEKPKSENESKGVCSSASPKSSKGASDNIKPGDKPKSTSSSTKSTSSPTEMTKSGNKSKSTSASPKPTSGTPAKTKPDGKSVSSDMKSTNKSPDDARRSGRRSPRPRDDRKSDKQKSQTRERSRRREDTKTDNKVSSKRRSPMEESSRGDTSNKRARTDNGSVHQLSKKISSQSSEVAARKIDEKAKDEGETMDYSVEDEDRGLNEEDLKILEIQLAEAGMDGDDFEMELSEDIDAVKDSNKQHAETNQAEQIEEEKQPECFIEITLSDDEDDDVIVIEEESTPPQEQIYIDISSDHEMDVSESVPNGKTLKDDKDGKENNSDTVVLDINVITASPIKVHSKSNVSGKHVEHKDIDSVKTYTGKQRKSDDKSDVQISTTVIEPTYNINKQQDSFNAGVLEQEPKHTSEHLEKAIKDMTDAENLKKTGNEPSNDERLKKVFKCTSENPVHEAQDPSNKAHENVAGCISNAEENAKSASSAGNLKQDVKGTVSEEVVKEDKSSAEKKLEKSVDDDVCHLDDVSEEEDDETDDFENFNDFIASQLGEEFVTVDDIDDESENVIKDDEKCVSKTITTESQNAHHHIDSSPRKGGTDDNPINISLSENFNVEKKAENNGRQVKNMNSEMCEISVELGDIAEQQKSSDDHSGVYNEGFNLTLSPVSSIEEGIEIILASELSDIDSPEEAYNNTVSPELETSTEMIDEVHNNFLPPSNKLDRDEMKESTKSVPGTTVDISEESKQMKLPTDTCETPSDLKFKSTRAADNHITKDCSLSTKDIVSSADNDSKLDSSEKEQADCGSPENIIDGEELDMSQFITVDEGLDEDQDDSLKEEQPGQSSMLEKEDEHNANSIKGEEEDASPMAKKDQQPDHSPVVHEHDVDSLQDEKDETSPPTKEEKDKQPDHSPVSHEHHADSLLDEKDDTSPTAKEKEEDKLPDHGPNQEKRDELGNDSSLEENMEDIEAELGAEDLLEGDVVDEVNSEDSDDEEFDIEGFEVVDDADDDNQEEETTQASDSKSHVEDSSSRRGLNTGSNDAKSTSYSNEEQQRSSRSRDVVDEEQRQRGQRYSHGSQREGSKQRQPSYSSDRKGEQYASPQQKTFQGGNHRGRGRFNRGGKYRGRGGYPHGNYY